MGTPTPTVPDSSVAEPMIPTAGADLPVTPPAAVPDETPAPAAEEPAEPVVPGSEEPPENPIKPAI